MAKVLLKVAPNAGDPAKGSDGLILTAQKPQIDTDFDIRDRLAELVGKGNALGADDKAAIYGSLVSALGKEKAAKIMNHAYIFNQRGDMQTLPLEERLKSLYTIGSNDPEIAQILAKTKSLGYGVVPGLRESSSALNQELVGRTQPVATTSISPELQKKIMLRVNK